MMSTTTATLPTYDQLGWSVKQTPSTTATLPTIKSTHQSTTIEVHTPRWRKQSTVACQLKSRQFSGMELVRLTPQGKGKQYKHCGAVSHTPPLQLLLGFVWIKQLGENGQEKQKKQNRARS
eukprot:TRINITY_DN66698_c0_g2_i1.p1 TRINITY_DN66698_c0_g2~~TRINITY_DN66698_c0_g2_i1.p1  ORF type:complete len:121 (+),score=11.41 TRINITY_DN66698_c0_g2_i1:221-583(+)